MKTEMAVGEYTEFCRRLIVCRECPEEVADPCTICCLNDSIACLAVHCMETNRKDRKTVYFKKLGYRRKKYAHEK